MNLKQTNYLCLGISVIPFFLAIIYHSRLIPSPSTHLFSSNSINPSYVDKNMFILLVLFCGLGFYFLSITAATYLPIVFVKLNATIFRYFINSILAMLLLVLVFTNLK